MNRRRAVAAERGQMDGTTVAFMLSESVSRVEPVILHHHLIPRHLSHNRRCGNGNREPIPLLDSPLVRKNLSPCLQILHRYLMRSIYQEVIRERPDLP